MATTPRVEVQVTSGAVMEQQFLFPNGTWIRNTWKAQLKIRCVTNRTSAQGKTMAHTTLLGLVRYCLQQYQATNSWNNVEWRMILDTIMEEGTEQTFSDEKDLDYSDLTWSIMGNINPLLLISAATSAVN